MVIPSALKSRPFRLYWIGQMISMAGSQMQIWALYWHLRTLSDQPMVISGIGLARFLPIVVLSLVAGVAADRFNRRRLTILTQVILGLLAVVLGLCTAASAATIWLLFFLITIQSLAVAFDVPARQALIPALVSNADLASAYSLTSIAGKIGGILGPALSGIVIAYLGLQWAYWINAISYVAVIVALIAMGNVGAAPERRRFDGRQTWIDIKAGLEYMKNSPIILSAMILDFFGSFFSSADTLLPFVARDVLHVGAVEYGWLSASPAAGTLLTGLYLSQHTRIRREGLIMSAAVVLFGFATVLLGLSRWFWLTLLALVLIGAFDGLSTIIRNTVRQILTPDEMRGRMMSISQVFFKGGPQLGEMESGLAAQVLGVPLAIITGGLGCVLATGLILRKFPQLLAYDGGAGNGNEVPGGPAARRSSFVHPTR